MAIAPLLALLIWVSAPHAALASCSDLPSAGVDWRSCNLAGVGFPDSVMAGGNLRGAALSNADHSGSDFSGIDGYRVRFVESDLTGAIFDGATLTDARFDRAD
ncbi:MAG: pentapeptide repeat-containing protein, partial [Rhodospirillaceae bacterium]|nr:pentapeptide repeat-containing protein [Rhodospirillaceae bacterium]